MDDMREEILDILDQLIKNDKGRDFLKDVPTENLEKALQVIEEFGSDIDLETIKKRAGEN